MYVICGILGMLCGMIIIGAPIIGFDPLVSIGIGLSLFIATIGPITMINKFLEFKSHYNASKNIFKIIIAFLTPSK